MQIMQIMQRTEAIEYKDIAASEMRITNERLGIMEGLMNRIGNVDYQKDRALRGNWRDTIKDAYARKAMGDPYLVPFLLSHNVDALPPGGVFYLDETREGLFGKVQFTLDIQSGAETYASYRAGTLSKQSVGYKCLEYDYVKEQGETIRQLKKCDLLECSAVIFPANPLAVASTVKRYWPGWSSKGQASGKTTWPLADRNTSWDAGQARKDIQAWAGDDKGKMAQCFFWVAQSPPEILGDCKLPFVMNVGGTMKAIPQGIISCAGVIQGAMGGAHIDDTDAVKSKIGAYYNRMDMDVPWGKGADMDYDTKENRMLSAQTITVLKKATDGITGHVEDMQRHMAAMRANSLQGYPVYNASDDESYDIASALAALVDELEGKAGAAISAENHQTIAEATTNIMRHVTVIKRVINRAEAQRRNALQGYQLYPTSSSDESFDTKEDPAITELRELRESLGTPPSRSLESRMDELSAKIGLNLAMANLLTSE